MRILGYILYYGLALAVGLMFGVLQYPRTTYYHNGERINMSDVSTEFIMENIEEIRTKSTVDLNSVPNTFLKAFAGFRVDLLPSFRIRGDVSTPSTLNNLALGGWVALLLGSAGGLHALFRNDTEA